MKNIKKYLSYLLAFLTLIPFVGGSLTSCISEEDTIGIIGGADGPTAIFVSGIFDGESHETSYTDEYDYSDISDVSDISDADVTEAVIDVDGIYDGCAEVALYIHTYGTLPSNYITKEDARELGWSGGSVEEYAPGKCIGGSRFGNYEGLLPEDSYLECDLNTLGKSSRGAERLVYSDDGDIYYTGDHYETFELLYEGED